MFEFEFFQKYVKQTIKLEQPQHIKKVNKTYFKFTTLLEVSHPINCSKKKSARGSKI